MLKLLKRKRKVTLENLLLLLLEFYKQDEYEVNVSELLESVQNVQEKIDLGYKFSDKVFYSSNFFADLNKLVDMGYVRRYTYRHNGYLPKNYVLLTSVGKKRAEELLASITEEEKIQIFTESVAKAIKDHRERYKIWARPLIKERKGIL